MPRKKVTEVSGNGGANKKRAGVKRKERDLSSDDEFEYEQENNKKPGKPAAKSGLQPVTVAEDVKEKIVSVILCPHKARQIPKCHCGCSIHTTLHHTTPFMVYP